MQSKNNSKKKKKNLMRSEGYSWYFLWEILQLLLILIIIKLIFHSSLKCMREFYFLL